MCITKAQHEEDKVKREKRFQILKSQFPVPVQEKGMALIIVVLVLAFLQIVGLVLLRVTATGPRVALNIRSQQQAYNAAEAGLDVTWTEVEELFSLGEWAHFEGHYLTELSGIADPSGIDDPQSNNYFRRLTDLELLNFIDSDWDGTPDVSTVIYCRQRYAQTQGEELDTRFRYTVFLIDDEAGSGIADPSDAILVCIGSTEIGENITTSRLEIELVIERPGT